MPDAGWKWDEVVEPFPREVWLDWCDADLEQLVCDGLDELMRRGKVNANMERWFAL